MQPNWLESSVHKGYRYIYKVKGVHICKIRALAFTTDTGHLLDQNIIIGMIALYSRLIRTYKRTPDVL